jgi:hypothetical protein
MGRLDRRRGTWRNAQPGANSVEGGAGDRYLAGDLAMAPAGSKKVEDLAIPLMAVGPALPFELTTG